MRKRRHRWMRGDWQIAAWLSPRVPAVEGCNRTNPLSALSRWKIFDNLRRCLVPIALISLLILGWTVFADYGTAATLLVLAIIFLPGMISLTADLVRKAA